MEEKLHTQLLNYILKCYCFSQECAKTYNGLILCDIDGMCLLHKRLDAGAIMMKKKNRIKEKSHNSKETASNHRINLINTKKLILLTVRPALRLYTKNSRLATYSCFHFF